MTLTIYTEFEQNSPLWFLARLGLPTTSCLKVIMAKGVKDARSVTRQRYLDRLTAELMTGMPVETYRNQAMQRGHDWEPDGMAAYIAKTGYAVDHVAFVRNHEINCGGSPDGLVGQDGGVEIKTLAPDLMVALVCAPGAPQEHIPQVQGLMWVTGRQWWDLVIYSPGFDLYVERIGRDHTIIDEIKRYLETFQRELEARVLQATGGEYTFKGLRKLRDQHLIERIEEEGHIHHDMPEEQETLQRQAEMSVTEAFRASVTAEGVKP